ncbi:MAG: hypothetical protein NZT92_14655 [Abditibacteriales bacterium]|nr:hypothetical protein [Abditibacteriales bacterium]
MNDEPWRAIFEAYNIHTHDFTASPFNITADQIKQATRDFQQTNQREVRILCKQDTRESRPQVFKDRGLFILPTRNGEYCILQGEGYVDIPPIESELQVHQSCLDFQLLSSRIGNSEMQHLDYAYATSLIRAFLNDQTLVLTIRGRKYTPPFDFRVGRHTIRVQGVQTEVDAGYEGRDQIALVEAKNAGDTNVIIRQLFYPFRQWLQHTGKTVKTLFFEKQEHEYRIWHFHFRDQNDYNSIELLESKRFRIVES